MDLSYARKGNDKRHTFIYLAEKLVYEMEPANLVAAKLQ